MKHFNKSQSSIEFMIIFGIAFVMILMLSALFFNYSDGVKKSLDKKQIDRVATDLISNIEKIYFLGSGNRVTMKANFPEGINNLTLYHRNNSDGETFDYLNFSFVDQREIISQIYLTSDLYIRFNCTSCYHNNIINISYFNSSDYASGAKTIEIESQGDYVTFRFVK